MGTGLDFLLCGLGKYADYSAREMRPGRGDWRSACGSSALPLLMEPGFTMGCLLRLGAF